MLQGNAKWFGFMFQKPLALWLLLKMQIHEAKVGDVPLSPTSWGTQVVSRGGLFDMELKFSDFHFCEKGGKKEKI